MMKLRLWLPALVLALAAAGAEWFARAKGFGNPPLAMTDPDVGYRLVPNQARSRFGNAIQINRYGFRSTDADLRQQPADRHMLILGDSVVYGNHHIDQSQTVAAQLQASLRAVPGQQQFIVSSVAVSGWAPRNELAFYRQLPVMPAEWAWLVISSHDLSDPVDLAQQEIPFRLREPACALIDLVASAADKLRERLSARQATEDHARYRSSEPSLRQLLALMKSRHGHVGLYFHFTRTETLAGRVPAELAVVQRVTQELQVPLVVSRQAYLDAASRGVEVFHDEIHLSGAGAHLLARQLAAQLPPEMAGPTP